MGWLPLYSCSGGGRFLVGGLPLYSCSRMQPNRSTVQVEDGHSSPEQSTAANDSLRVGREGYRESRRCSRDTYPDLFVT